MDLNLFDSLNISEETLRLLKQILMVMAIGLLIGLEREHSEVREDKPDSFLIGGIRTFPLVGLIGYMVVYLSVNFLSWLYPVGLLAVSLFVMTGYVWSRYKSSAGKNIGTTTEFALIATFLLSGIVFLEQYLVAIFLTLLITALLAFKVNLHQAVKIMSKREVLSILLFFVLTALILPVLPDKNFGPYGAFNLFKFWLIISVFLALNFVGYFLHKFIRSEYSILTTGVLGGFASSTATAWYFSRLGGKTDKGGVVHVAAIVLASSIMFPRLLIWLVILSPELLAEVWIPVMVFGLIGFGVGLYYSKKSLDSPSMDLPEIKNPINFRDALTFGVIYILIVLLVGYLEEQMGDKGVLVAAGISGVTDVDAITISMANYASGDLAVSIAAVGVLIAAFSNTLIKFLFCLIFGNNRMRKYASMAFVPLFVLGTVYIIFLLLK